MRTIFAVLLLIGSCTITYSQINVSGVILDSITQEPLAQALIKIGSDQAVADNKGAFRINNLSKGEHTMVVSHVGCKSKTLSFTVTENTYITVLLPHHLHTFDEVISYGHHNNSEPSTHKVQTISQTKLEQTAAISLSDALEGVGGVTFLKTGTTISKPIINGMHSNRISVINDDSKQEGQQWGTEHAPEIDPLSAGKIELIKGAYTLKFGGDAMGGVIRLLPADFDDSSYIKTTLLTKVESNPLGAQLGIKLESNNKPKAWSQRLVINVKRNGDAKAQNYVLSNTGFGQLSGSYFLKYQQNKNQFSFTASGFVQRLGILTASHIGNLTDLKIALKSDTPLIVNPFTFQIQSPSQLIQHYSGRFKWITKNQTLGEISTSYTFQNNHRQEFDNHDEGNKAALDLNLWTHQFNALADKHFNTFRWQYGTTFELQQNIGAGRYFIPNYIRYKTGAFAIATLEKDKHLVECGLRYDWQNASTYRYENDSLLNNILNFNGLSANVSGWRAISEDIKFHASLATRFRNPDINELFSNGLHHGSAALEFGDISLSQERSYSVNTSIYYNHNRLKIQVEPYFYYFSNYIYLKPSGETQLTIRGAFPVFNYVQTNATYTGSDFDIRYRLFNNLTAIAKTSLLVVRDIKNNKYIYGIPAQQAEFKLNYIFPDFGAIRNGHLSINCNYTAKQNLVEIDEDFDETPEEYFLFNTEIGGQYKQSPMYFNLGIRNMLNTSYRNYMNRYRYYADDTGINIYVTLNYKFI